MSKRSDDLDYFWSANPIPSGVDIHREPSCWHSHLPFTLPGVKGKIHGGNCGDHGGTRADIYVALDEGLARPPRFRPEGPVQPVSVVYPIANMKAPNRPEKFAILVNYLHNALNMGLEVHIGCIGGHGRTGLVIAALAAKEGVQNPITWTRENYCHKAVETKDQVNFLVAHYGAELVQGSYSKKG